MSVPLYSSPVPPYQRRETQGDGNFEALLVFGEIDVTLVSCIFQARGKKVLSLLGDYLHRVGAGIDERHSSGRLCSTLGKIRPSTN